MKLDIRTSAIILSLLLGGAALLYQNYEHNRDIKDLEEKRQALIDQVEEKTREELDRTKAERDSIFIAMSSQVDSLLSHSEKLNRKIRYYETRPDFDLDFISAAGILSDAEYRPTEGNGNPN